MYKRRVCTIIITADPSSVASFKVEPRPSPIASSSKSSYTTIIYVIVVTYNPNTKTDPTGMQTVRIFPDKTECGHDGQNFNVTIIHHEHGRSISDTTGTDLGQNSWQWIAKTVFDFKKIVKLTSLTFIQCHGRLGWRQVNWFSQNGRKWARRSTRDTNALNSKAEGADEAKAFTMG